MATKKNNPYDEAGKKTSDLLKKFAEMMIKIIEKGKGEDWKKGWLGTAGKFKGLPQNINGRTYSGSNSFFLSFHTADNNYKAPVYMTFNQAKNQELRINAGEKSVPVFKWSRTIKDENNNKISEEEYNAMSQEEREKLTIRTYPRSFNVFNIDQTNLKEANKEKYDSIVSRFEVPQEVAKDTKGMYVNEAMDRMFEKQEWHSKIQYDQPSDQAYYNPSNDRIVLPMKEQFNKGETPEEKYQGGQAYYATALHEMAHSTGHPTRLNRTFEGKFGSSKYAHEELIAETTSALVGSAIGFDKKITENSGNYLSGWLKTLRKTPEMIANIMSDVSKAADMIIAKIDEQRIALGQKPLKSEDSENIDENINERENKEIETKPAFTEEQKLYKESPQTTAAEKSAENDIYVSKYLGSGTLSEAKDVYWVDSEETAVDFYQLAAAKNPAVKDAAFVVTGNNPNAKQIHQALDETAAAKQHLVFDKGIYAVAKIDQEIDRRNRENIVVTPENKAYVDDLKTLSLSSSMSISAGNSDLLSKEVLEKYEKYEKSEGENRLELYNDYRDALKDFLGLSNGRAIEAENISPDAFYGKAFEVTFAEDPNFRTIVKYSKEAGIPTVELPEAAETLKRKEFINLLLFEKGNAAEAKHVYWFDSESEASAFYQLNKAKDPSLKDAPFIITKGNPPQEQIQEVLAETATAKHHICTAGWGNNSNEEILKAINTLRNENIVITPENKEYVESIPLGSHFGEGDEDLLPKDLQDKIGAAQDAEAEWYEMAGLIDFEREEFEKKAKKLYADFDKSLKEYLGLSGKEVIEVSQPRPENSATWSQELEKVKAEGLGVEKSREDIQSEEKTSLTLQEDPYSASEIEDAVAYGTISKLEYIQMFPLEGMQERYNSYCNQHKIDSQREESAVAFLDYVKYNNLAAKWWPETFQTEEAQENVSLSEDNDPKTDLAGVTEKIMESNHVSKEQATKMAAPIVEKQVAAANEKKQKAEQVKQESIKKADEAKRQEEQRRREAEVQRLRQEENSKHDKNDGYTSKIVLHAALLLGALELAKGNKGIWMNKAGKSNAEFLGQKTPISPYNSVMMNLHSDQKGYSTNVYTSFADLKKSDDYVKTNEKSLPFNWTHWDYQNIATKEIIERSKYNKLPEEEKSLYTKHSTRQSLPIFNIEQTSLTSKEIYRDILRENGTKFEKLSERGVSSMMKFAEKLKENHPTALVIAKQDNGYRMYGKDANKANKVLGLTLTQTELNGEKIKYTSFPHDRLDSYLPKLIQAKQWVVVADSLDSAELIRGVPDEKEILNKAYSSVQKFAKAAGADYERVLVLQNSEYDKANDKIVISGKNYSNTGNKRQAAIEKANDIYRTMVAATGSEQRLDRMGRNNLLPKDDTKYEHFVQDIAAGILMARQGLPAILSKENMQHIDYWKREIRENPKLMGVLEKDVNNAIESIDRHMKQEVVMYKTIRDGFPPKDLAVDARQYQISGDLAKLPDIDSKEIVIVKDKAKGFADVILPEGASLEENVEISGIRKDRIRTALGKEGINDVKFYNAGGAFALKETNDYYKDKTIVTGRLKQYEFVQSKEIDASPQIEAAAEKKIDIFTHIRDAKGQYAFFIKPENEPSFSIYPSDVHKRTYFDVIKTDEKDKIHNALAQKYYAVASKNPEVKVELVMPKTQGLDMSKIERSTITKDREDPNKKYVTATVDGQFMKKEISKDQWNKMWLADDMAAYKRAVAAITFAPLLKEEKAKEVHQEEKQATRQEVKEESIDNKEEQSQSVEAKADAAEQSEEVQTEEPQRRKGMGLG